MVDYKEPEFNLAVIEEDLGVYMRVYRTLKDTFTTDTRMVILHVEGNLYEFRLIGLTSRDTLEFCANVFAELPTETVNLVEVGETENGEIVHMQIVEDGDTVAEEEEEYEEEEDEEESLNPDGETPSEEVERKLKKARLVRKTGSSAVTVETD